MATAKGPSAAFASREFNGEVLLDELDELKAAQVAQKHLGDLVAALRDFSVLRAVDATARLKQLAANRFAGQPALASLLVRWANRVKLDADVAALVSHFERLALSSAVITAMRRGVERLPRGGRG